MMFVIDDDVVTVTLTTQDRMFLRQLPQLLDEVTGAVHDPGYEVLHRDVYRDDRSASQEIAGLVASDSAELRSSDRSIVTRIGSGVDTMTREEAHGFLRSINEARLVIAARAGVFDRGQGWEENVASDPSLAAVAWLGYLQGELISALLAEGRTP